MKLEEFDKNKLINKQCDISSNSNCKLLIVKSKYNELCSINSYDLINTCRILLNPGVKLSLILVAISFYLLINC